VEAGNGVGPLPLVSVRLPELHREARTDANGGFVFTRVPAGRYGVVVRAIGFQPQTRRITVTPGDTVALAIRLEPAVVELSPVIVTGTVAERSPEDALSPTTVVGGAELDRRLAGTVAATLEREPGIAVSSLGPATAQPIIRGLGGDRIVVLEDGARPGDVASTGGGDHAIAVDPLTADRIEVVRGPMGLLYGSSALGGVVNVVRHDVPDAPIDRIRGGATLQGSSVNDGVAGGGRIQTGLGPLALHAEASGRRAGDTRTPSGTLEGTRVTTLNGQLGLGLAGDRRHAGVSYRFFDNEYGVPGGFIGGHASDVRIEMRRHTLRGEFGWHHPGLGLEALSANASYTAYYHRELEPSGNLGTSFEQDVGALDLVARHGEDVDPHQGAWGIRGQYRRIVTGGTLRTPTTRDVSAAVYGVEEWVVGRARVQGGLRYDFARYEPLEASTILVGGERIAVVPRTFHNVSGSAGLLIQLTEALRLGVNLARAFRTPDFNELYSSGPHLAANSFDVGDPRLAPETGLGGEVLARLTTPRVQAEAAAFVNLLDNCIFPSSRGRAELGAQGNRPRFQYTNEDARFAGAEGSLGIRLVGALQLDATASYVAARFTSDRAPIPVISASDTTFVAASEYPPLIPPALGSASLRWDTRRWFAGGGVRWALTQRRTGDFETPTDGYAAVQVAAGIRFVSRGLLHSVSLRVDNLLDTEYRDHTSRLKDIAPAAGRDVSLLYRLEF
jgi:iron complex outermembrane receptor protein